MKRAITGIALVAAGLLGSAAFASAASAGTVRPTTVHPASVHPATSGTATFTNWNECEITGEQWLAEGRIKDFECHGWNNPIPGGPNAWMNYDY